MIMNTKILFSFLSAILLSISAYAYSPETIVLSNIENTEKGCIKEFLFCDKETNAPISKTVYNYDAEGRMLDKCMYEWNSSKGWIGVQKLEYNYEASNSPVAPVVKKWDKKNNKWEE